MWNAATPRPVRKGTRRVSPGNIVPLKGMKGESMRSFTRKASAHSVKLGKGGGETGIKNIHSAPLQATLAYECPVYPKGKEDAEFISIALQRNFVFTNALSDEDVSRKREMTQILEAFEKHRVSRTGVTILKATEVEDYFYILEEGCVEYKNTDPATIKSQVISMAKRPGQSFCKLCLLYDYPPIPTAFPAPSTAGPSAARTPACSGAYTRTPSARSWRCAPCAATSGSGTPSARSRTSAASTTSSSSASPTPWTCGRSGRGKRCKIFGEESLTPDKNMKFAGPKGGRKYWGETIEEVSNAAECGKLTLSNIESVIMDLHPIGCRRLVKPKRAGAPRASSVKEARPESLDDLTFHQFFGTGTFERVYCTDRLGAARPTRSRSSQRGSCSTSARARRPGGGHAVMARLDHPFVCSLVSMFQDNACIYMLLSMIQRGELRNLIQGGRCTGGCRRSRPNSTPRG